MAFRIGGNAMNRLSFLEQTKIKACVAYRCARTRYLIVAQQDVRHAENVRDVLASRLGKSVV
ncbi:alpha/beta hydrolase [Vibrio sinus]|uniref:alpha/beta hydrolase n=1 Tax=Vibrio sinus TaxID=2946865 RepID=UPI003D7D1009